MRRSRVRSPSSPPKFSALPLSVGRFHFRVPRGWEKGQAENQVSHVREQIFTPRLRATSLADALIHYDRNRYSVDTRFASKTVSVCAYADRIAAVVGRHDRSFERDRTFFDPWHYVPALDKKPGALRNGAFQGWETAQAAARCERSLAAKARWRSAIRFDPAGRRHRRAGACHRGLRAGARRRHTRRLGIGIRSSQFGGSRTEIFLPLKQMY